MSLFNVRSIMPTGAPFQTGPHFFRDACEFAERVAALGDTAIRLEVHRPAPGDPT